MSKDIKISKRTHRCTPRGTCYERMENAISRLFEKDECQYYDNIFHFFPEKAPKNCTVAQQAKAFMESEGKINAFFNEIVNNHITFPAAHISPELYIWETFPPDLITMQGWLCGLIDKIQAMMNGNFNVNIYLVKARTFKVEQADSQII